MVYQVLIRLLSPLIVLITVFEALKKQGGWTHVIQRLGLHGSSSVTTSNDLWIHCASVGEINAAIPLINRLLTENPTLNIIATTNTPSGYQFLQHTLPHISLSYCPVDWPYAINQFIARYHPKKLYVIETEIWPNLYQSCFENNIPIQIINGRISNKTLKAPNWLKHSYQNALQKVDLILGRSPEDSKRFIDLGALPDRVLTVGNIKYAALTPTNPQPNPLKPLKREFVLVASTHADEEKLIVGAWQRLKRSELLVLVPRHPKRKADIESQLAITHTHFVTSSTNQPVSDDTDVFLVDQIGVLHPFFEHAKFVVMGGSFVNKGGHNILEPASYGKAVITGPFMHNFSEDLHALMTEKAILQCHSIDELETKLLYLLNAPHYAAQIGHNAQRFIQSRSGILDAYVQHLR